MLHRLPPASALAAAALLALAVVLAACQETEEDPSQVATEAPAATATPAPRTPGPGETLWRWVNVTVLVRNDSGILVARDFGHPGFEDGGPIMRILRRHPDKNIDSEVRIDADTGDVLLKSIDVIDAPFVEPVLQTIRVGEPLSGDPLPWPYGTVAPSRPKEEADGMSFWWPDPAAGIQVSSGCGGGDTASGACTLVLHNSRSFLSARVEMGRLVVSYERVNPEDQEVFARLGQSIELAKP